MSFAWSARPVQADRRAPRGVRIEHQRPHHTHAGAFVPFGRIVPHACDHSRPASRRIARSHPADSFRWRRHGIAPRNWLDSRHDDLRSGTPRSELLAGDAGWWQIASACDTGRRVPADSLGAGDLAGDAGRRESESMYRQAYENIKQLGSIKSISYRSLSAILDHIQCLRIWHC
jgi:hypothetical protein